MGRPRARPEALADRWVRELDANGVARAALIASVPGDEASVAAAVARHPARFVGFFMLDPSAADAPARTQRAVDASSALRGHLPVSGDASRPLNDDRVARVVEVAAAHPGTAVFVHCGVLSVGVRKKLGLPSRFDLRSAIRSACRAGARCSDVPFIIPHFGAGLLREALMAADVCPQHPPRHVELERLDSLHRRA